MIYNPETAANQRRYGSQNYNTGGGLRPPFTPTAVPSVFGGAAGNRGGGSTSRSGDRAPVAPPSTVDRFNNVMNRSPSASGGGDSDRASSFGGVSGGGGGAAFSSGGSLISTATGALAPAMPTDEEWLAGDTSYQAQLAALKKALEDYTAQDTLARSQYETDFGVNQQNLGRARTEGIASQENDFASRGMINSGLFANERSELEADFGRRGDELTRGRQNWLSGRDNALGNFKTEQNLTQQQVLADALARRAAQFGGF